MNPLCILHFSDRPSMKGGSNNIGPLLYPSFPSLSFYLTKFNEVSQQ